MIELDHLSPIRHTNEPIPRMRVKYDLGWGIGALSSQDKPLLLLVEDEALVALALETHLEDAGFDVLVASSGNKAIIELERENTGRFAGLITDIRLPEVNGWAVATRARELAPTLPVVYMSGDRGAEWAAYGVPDSIMLAKPFAAAQLISAVATLLNNVAPHSDNDPPGPA